MSIKLCLDVGNDECIILCNFSRCIMSGFEGIKGVGLRNFPGVSGTPKIDIICMRKGPQTNMPQKVGSREDLISKNMQSGPMEPKKPGLNRI